MSLGEIGISVPVLLGGFIGSLVAIVTKTDKVSLLRAISLIITGCAVSVYTQPILSSYLNISAELAPGIGFLLSLTSMDLVHKLEKFVDTIDLKSMAKKLKK